MPVTLLAVIIFAAGYLAGMTPAAWLVVRGRHGVDLRSRGGGTGPLDAFRVGGFATAFWSVLLEVFKGGLVGIVARLIVGPSWLTALAIAGCVTGDAFPPSLRRGGRGILPLISGLVVALPLAGIITGVVAGAVLATRREDRPVGTLVVAVAVPAGLVVGTDSWLSLIPAAIIVAVLLARMARPPRRLAALRPGRAVVIDNVRP